LHLPPEKVKLRQTLHWAAETALSQRVQALPMMK
jgi:hypothetical protein